MGVAVLWAGLNEPRRAAAMLAEYDRTVPASLRMRDTVDLSFHHFTQAMQQRRYDDALTVVRATEARDGACSRWCYAVVIARAHDARGDADSTLANLERYLLPLGGNRLEADRYDLPWALKRAGELHESRGETAKAIARYRELVQLWEKADAPLQPLVADLRQRIARLEAKRG